MLESEVRSKLNGQRIDCAEMGTDYFKFRPKYLHPNTSATYRIYSGNNNSYVDMYLYKGLQYEAEGINKITTTGDAAITAGDLTLVF